MSSIQFTARPRRPRWHLTVSVFFVLATMAGGVVDSGGRAGAAPPDHAKGGGDSDGEKCHPKKGCPDDTSPPEVTIADPDGGEVVAGVVDVTGSATDDSEVAGVEVYVDDMLVGSTSTSADTWSMAVDTAGLAPDSYMLSAVARDGAGNEDRDAVTITVADEETGASGDLAWQDQVVTNPAEEGNSLVEAGLDRIAAAGDQSVLLYTPRFANRTWAMVRDRATSGEAHVELPMDSLKGWSGLRYALGADGTLWTVGGSSEGRVIRRYQLAPWPTPDSASLIESWTVGDDDSRGGDVIILADGGVVVAWHQQGADGRPQGHGIWHRATDGSVSQQFVDGLRTRSSKEVIVQHPGDGSVWLFSVPDAWGSVQAMRLTVGASGLALDWYDREWISDADGPYDADPEHPWLAAVPDPSTGTIVLAYQSAERYVFATEPWIVGSHVALSRIQPDESRAFWSHEVYVERVSRFGLAVDGGDTWLAYRPVANDLSYDDVHVARHRDGAWTSAEVATLANPDGSILYAADRPEFAAALSDGALHHLQFSRS